MTGLLVFAIFVLTVFILGAYSIVAPWWTTRAGKAYFILFMALAMLAGFFLVQRLIGPQPDWAKDTALTLVAAAIAWNGYTIISKQIRKWRESQHATPTPMDPTGGH